MATLTFETLRFTDRGEQIEATFLRMYRFLIPREELEALGEFSVVEGTLEFADIKQASLDRKFNRILNKGFLNLQNKLSGKPTVYLHRGSGIPLRSHISFGIIDRGSNIIEVKPITSCNIACTYCSVNEDVRPVDFIVDVDYMIEELKDHLDQKGCDDIEAHIASQGEPFLYDDMLLLVKKLSALPQVNRITTDTNGTVLTPAKIDALIEAGFTRFNLSINAIDPDRAKEIAGAPYSIEQVKNVAKHIAEHPDCDLCIAPTMIKGLNEDQMPKILAFAKSLENPNWVPKVGIQNFLEYQFGRNPSTQIPWDNFFEQLRSWEKEFGLKLLLTEEDFNIIKSPAGPKVFRKGEVVKAEIKCRGRLPGEKIAVARDRVISLPKCHQTKGPVKIKITKTKHHLYTGVVLS